LTDAADRTVPDVRLRLVQPSIDQRLKWRPELRGGHVARQLGMSQGPWRPAQDAASQPEAAAGPTHVIWGETALPFLLEREPLLQQALGRLVPPGGAVITGAPRASDLTDHAQLYNSIQVIDASGRIVATYDKVHLVPFGEYVPLHGWLPIEKVAQGQRDFSAGAALQTLSLPGLPPASPLICYEVIFPGAVALRDRRPAWLLNLTNDAWFGRTSGPYQHFAAARLRAVEEGLPVVRVANTGISAVIDGFGRTRASLGLGVDGVLDARLPAALPPTPYVLWGDAPALAVCLLIILGTALVSCRSALPLA
ncbi:MAG: apolipoprotein N-acyltransferase, partial [Proteobacteria bacterium]|nr:apolipoprotein N-acyltransferase [Pseudomonadota bacterium]